MRVTSRFCSLLATVALLSPSASAEWRVYPPATGSQPGTGEVATVTNASGHSLRVYRDGDGFVYGEFVLRRGLHALARTTCPSYQIDLKRPVALRYERDWCEVSDHSARFRLGRAEGDRVESKALIGLMNGTRLRFRFHLTGLGYQETEFSLRGSKQALNQAMGTGVRVVRENRPGPPVPATPEDTLD